MAIGYQHEAVKLMKAQTPLTAFALAATFVFLSSSINRSADEAKANCQKIAECAQQLVDIANKLVDENVQLTKRVVALEDDLAKYKSANDNLVKSLGARLDQLHVFANGPDQVKEVHQGDFWNATPTNTVGWTCGGANSVLVGMEFDLTGINGVRTPTRYKFLCRELRP